MFGFQQLFTDPCPELTKEHQQAMKGFDCADNEIDLKAGVEGAPLIPCEKPSALLDMIVCLRVEGLGLSPEIREGVRDGVVF